MCLSDIAKQEIRALMQILEQTSINGSAPSYDLIIASACKNTAPEYTAAPSKTQLKRFFSLFRFIHERAPSSFPNSNSRNQAAKRLARSGSYEGMKKFTVKEFESKLKDDEN